MALIAHWPLNGNTNDISGNNNNGTVSNITYESGKIGQAAAFNGTSSYISVNNLLTETGAFSFSAWIKTTNSAVTQNIVCSRTAVGGGFSIFILGSQIRFDAGISWQWSTGYTVSSNQWIHIVVTRNLSTGRKLFVNGTLYASTADPGDMASLYSLMTFGASQASGSGISNFLVGNLNDIRLYNHALTDLEIQEIARAKILHYTFDDMQEPTTNIVSGIISNYGSGVTYSNGTSLFQVTRVSNSIIEGPYTYSRYTGTINSSNNQVIWQLSYRGVADYGKTFTVSAYLRGTGTCHFTLYDDGTSYKVSPDFTLTSNWMRYTYTGTYSSTYTTNHWVALRGILDTTTVDISSLQIEEKTYPTEFTLNSRTGRINDYSGFYSHSNLLTEANTPRWVPDSKIGLGAYLFNNSIIPGPGPFRISTDFLTLAAWVKPIGAHSDDRGIVIQQNGNYYLTVTPSQQVSVYWYNTSNPGYHTTTETLILNEWSHIATVWNGAQNLIYINGVLVKTTATTTPGLAIGGSPLTIGRETTNRRFNGYIDDVRQYATALSNTDILDLYNTRAQVEQTGTLYAKDILSNSEGAINLITSKLDSFPSIGMGHRTYSADSTGTYNNNIAYSIGNLISITNNIATFDGTGKALYTYDCIYPLSTGGGLTSGVEYFIKKHGTNQYSFHTYNGSDDGSQAYINETTGGFQVHYSVDSDTRIAINTTNFPISWKGNPHKANQSMVKQVIPNGFNYRGRIHDCVRIVTSHRYPDPINSYMAYGVYPQAIAGNYYTFSFYARAINSAAVGKNISLTLYTSGSWSNGALGRNYGYGMPLTTEWQRYEMTALAPNSGGTNMYFPGINGGGDAEISEIQCEQKLFATEFTTSYRPFTQLPSTLEFAANEIHETGTANFEDFSTIGITDGLIGYWPFDGNTLDYSGNSYHGVEYSTGVMPIINSDNIQFQDGDGLKVEGIIGKVNKKPFSIIVMTSPINLGGRIAMGYTPNVLELNISSNSAGITLRDSGGYRTASYSGTMTANVPFLFTGTFDGSTLKYYHNGQFASQYLNHLNDVDFGENLLFGNWISLTQSYLGKIYYAKVFNRALTAEEVAIEYNTMFNNQAQIHNSGVLYAKDIIQY